MPNERVARILHVTQNWGDAVFDQARKLERGLAEAAADALVDAMADEFDVPSALAHASLSPAEEELRAVHTMEAEVSTNGLLDFFDNCGREEAVLAAAGCARIGATAFESIVREALELVPEVPEDDWPAELEEELSELDERFYDAYEEVEGLLLLRLKYAAEHPDEFRGLAG